VRAVVIGGSGQIGGWLLRHLALRGHEAVGTFASVPVPGLHRLDSAGPDTLAWLREQRPDVVFYPAGLTWVDGCERDPALAAASNLDQPLTIARAACEAGARFVYFSTDYVFDGSAGPSGESDAPAPLNVYGRVKLQAERALAEEFDDAVLVARTCWVYGPERQGKNFAYQLVRALRDGRPFACPSDQWANPSYGPDVALAAVRCAEERLGGVIHLAGPRWTDRPSFARAIAEAFGLDASPVRIAPTGELNQGAPRPLRSGLRSERLGSFLPGLIRDLPEALADFRGRLAVGEPWATP
jgi:dTDP-4-dehydrorhamnose reductase